MRHALSLDALVEAADDIDGEGFDFMADGAPDLADYVIRAEEMASVYAAIEALPDWQQAAVVMVDVHGCGYDEAAQWLGVPIGTVKSRLSRARAALRNAVKA